eukprot:5819706-Pleurochrysis_carterae.AAC.1
MGASSLPRGAPRAHRAAPASPAVYETVAAAPSWPSSIVSTASSKAPCVASPSTLRSRRP